MKHQLTALITVITALPLVIVLLLSDDQPPSTSTMSATAIPAQYHDDVLRAGNLCPHITPAIIAAQIDAESGWNPDATSPAGAQGIAQFMPATWASAGKDGDGDGKANPFNPHDAILSQGHLMCANVQAAQALIDAGNATGNVVELALAGYNAGMGAVQTYGGIPPYRETQAYVPKIMNLARITYAAPTSPGPSTTAPLTWAKAQIGKPYRGQGSGQCGSFGPDCFDCCGLIHQAFLHATGIDLPMSVPGNPWATSKCEYALLARATDYGAHVVSSHALQVGDIVFFQNTATPESVDYITHVGFYLGEGNVLDAVPGHGVGIRPLSWYANSERLLPQAVRIGHAP